MLNDFRLREICTGTTFPACILENETSEEGLPPCRRSRTAGGVYRPSVVWLGGFTSQGIVV